MAPLGPVGGGGSQAFLVRADDGRRYWCKALNNPQGPRVPVNEQIVARLGGLIGIAVCEPVLVRIPDEFAGTTLSNGHLLEPGWAHGSLAVEAARENRALEHRADDDNARRHVGFFALFDWLAGQDQQWLIAGDQEDAYVSHDHGHYFPGGPPWTVESLRQAVYALHAA